MKIVNKKQMEELMDTDDYLLGGLVFADYKPDIYLSDVKVTDGDFGATCVIPYEGEVFDFDWNIGEYSESDRFMIFDNNDVLQMIQTLTSGLKIKLEYE